MRVKALVSFSFLFLLFCIVPSAFAAIDPLPLPNSPYNIRDKYSTDLFTGGATYSYDIKVPKGTNGLTPKVSILYNSNGAHDYFQRAGAGWEINQDYIERDVNYTPGDTSDDKYRLHFQGGVYDLIYVSSDSRYHTTIESNLNIQKLTSTSNDYGDYWQVITPDGTKYRFGYATQSELVCNGRSYVASWNLDLVTDTHGNNVYYTYTESNGVSYISTIKYNNDQTREVDFNYATSSYQKQVYVQGCNITETSNLSTIQVKVGTNLIHEYDLSYNTATNNQQILHSITEKGSDSSSTLPATTFDYKAENQSWNTSPVTYLNHANLDVNLTQAADVMADVNGDGLVDIVKSEGNGTNTWTVYLNQGNDTFSTTGQLWLNNAPIDAKLDRTDTKLIDVNGDGLPDIIKTDSSSNWTVYRNTGNSWNTTGEGWASLGSHGNIYLGAVGIGVYDVTGDGLPDVVQTWWNGAEEWRIYRNTGSGWNGTPEVWSHGGVGSGLDDTTIKLYDVNGDGLLDIVKATASGTNDTWQVWKNNGNGWNTTPETWINNAGIDANFSMSNVVVEDVNGDGLPDIVKSDDLGTADRWKVLLNQGNSWSTTWVNWIDPSSNVDLSLQATTQTTDVTGDGLPDIIRGSADCSCGYDTWQVWKNNGNAPDLLSAVHTSEGGTISYNYSRAASAVTSTTTMPSFTGYYYNNQMLSGSPTLTRTDSAINFNWGTGSPDPSINSDHFSARWTQTVSLTGGAYVFTVSTDDGVRLYIDGESVLDKWFDHGNYYYTVSKGLSTGNHTITLEYYEDTGGASAKFSYQKIGLQFPLWQVSQMTVDNGMTNSQNSNEVTTYNYSDALYKFEDHEFRGYGEIDTVEPNSSKRQYIFNQDDAAKGRLASVITNDSSNNPYAKIEDTWSNASSSGVFTVNLTSEKNYTYDGSASNPKTTETDYTYDSYGNVTKKSEKGDTSTSSDDRFTYFEYTASPSAWIVNTPKHTYKNKSDDLTKISESWFYYDSNASYNDAPTKGDLTKEEKWLSGGTDPVTIYAYDSYGNQTSVTDANSHTTSTAYGTNDTTHTYPDSSTNAKSQTTSYSYDLGSGNLLSQTDPNGFTTSYTYDVFGRITKEIKPYDSSSYPTVSYTYSFDGTAPESTLVSQRKVSSASGTLNVYTYTDGLGRKIQTRADAEDTSKQIVTDTYYDVNGQVKKVSVPHLDTLSTSYASPVSGIETTQTAYDVLGRPTTITNPDSTTKTVSYDHWVNTETNERSKQNKKYFNAFGKITRVDEFNGGSTYTTTYSYDANDMLTGIADALNDLSAFTYDTLGRKTSMTDYDYNGTWTYGYDGVGNLTSQTDPKNVTVTKSYDQLNRVTGINYPTDTDTSYTYDGNSKIGTLTSVTDAAGTVNYSYDNRLRKTQEQRIISGTTKNTQYSYDAADRMVTQTNPDGETVTYAFNNQGEINSATTSATLLSNVDYNALGKITQKNFGNGVTTNYTYNTTDFRLNRIQTGSLFDKSYTYDGVGNITGITDNISSKTNNYSYDDLDRLTSASQSGAFNNTYSYDSIGDLISSTDGPSKITYGYGNNGPVHGVTSRSGTKTQTFATPTMVQGPGIGVTENTSSSAVSLPSNVAAGNMLFVGLTWSSGSVSSVTDNQGDTFTAVTTAQHANTSNDYVAMYYAKNVKGGSTTVTVTFSTSTQHNVGVDEFSGVDKYSPLDQVTSATGTSSSPNGGTIAASQNNDLLLAIGVDDNGNNVAATAGSGYTILDTVNTTAEERYYTEDRVSPIGNYQTNFTIGTSSHWAVIGAAFKAGPSSTQTPTMVQGPGIGVTEITNSSQISFPSNVTKGNVIIVPITWGSGSISSISDNNGDTFTQVTPAVHANISNDYVALYYANNVTGGSTTVTVNFSTSTKHNVGVYEYSGIDATTALDSAVSNTGTSTAPNGGNLTSTNDNELYFAVGVDDNGNNVAASGGSGYTLLDTVNTTAQERYYTEDRVSTKGTYSTDFSIAVSSHWAVIGAAFRPSSLATVSNTYSYDNDGNMTGDGTQCFDYNEANEMKTVKDCGNNQTIAEYVYDYNGNRMIKKNYSGGTLNNTVYSWTDSYETKDTGGTITTTVYYFANNELIAKKNPDGSLYYIHTDHLGSTSVVTDSSGNVVEYTVYDPWGEVETGGTASKFLYTGQEKDSETGLNYYNFRYYNSDIKRFIQPDDIIPNIYNPQTLNRFSYANNNPLRYTDPTGHISVLNYNSALTQYYKNPNASTYNNVLTVMNQFTTMSGNSGSSGSSAPKTNQGGTDNLKPSAHGNNSANTVPVSLTLEEALSLNAARTGSIYWTLTPQGPPSYIGQTINFARRYQEWYRLGEIREQVPGLKSVPEEDLDGIEQALINKYGLENLDNKINVISTNNPKYENAVKTGEGYLEKLNLPESQNITEPVEPVTNPVGPPEIPPLIIEP